MVQFLDWTNNKKTYITIGIGIAVGVAQAFHVPIPSWLDWMLGFAGLGFHRLAVAKQSKLTLDLINAIQASTVVVQDVSSQVVVSTPTFNQPSPTNVPEAQVTADLNRAQLK